MNQSTWLAVAVALCLSPFTAAAQSGNASRGERVFNQQCKVCHTVDKGSQNRLGPNLHGMFGREAGATEDFESSAAIKKSGIVWDDTTLAEYLKEPSKRVPGTKMAYAGLKQQAQLNDVIAYLRKATQ